MNPFLDHDEIDGALASGIIALDRPPPPVTGELPIVRKTVEAAAEVSVDLSPATVVHRLSTRFESSPHRREVDGVSYLGWASIVGSRALSARPALLVVYLRDGDATVHVHAYAREGMFKQRTARKAVDRFVASLRS